LSIRSRGRGAAADRARQQAEALDPGLRLSRSSLELRGLDPAAAESTNKASNP